jgi:plasmid maintenance system antidote protein VapI
MSFKRTLQPTQPGEILRENVSLELGLLVVDAAAKLGITRQALQRTVARASPT